MKQKTHDRLHIPDAEMEIAQLFWQLRRPVTSEEIGLALQHRQWKPSTIHTLAMNLERKGIVNYYKAGGRNYYFPAISEFEYRFVVTKDFLNETHGGSIVEMMELLLCDWDLTEDVLIKLRELINTAELPYDAFNRFPKNHTSDRERPSDHLPEDSAAHTASPAMYSVILTSALLEWFFWAVSRRNERIVPAPRHVSMLTETDQTKHHSINFDLPFIEFENSA